MAIIKRKYRKKNQLKPTIYYQAEVFIKGVRVSVKNFSTKREAVFWHEKERQKFTFSPTSLNDKMKFKDCLDKFWEDAETRMMKSTLQSYECRLSYFHNSPLAQIKMSELKGVKIIEWIDWLREHRSNPVYWRIATFMLLTGTRIGETCGLKWDTVNLEKGFVRIIRRVRWDQRTKHPFLEDVTKTVQSARLLMLPKRLKDMLLEMKKETKGDLVFTNDKGELLRYNAVQSAFNAGFEALGLPWRSTHICRHTFATIALMETKNISAVQASLGHT